MFFLPRNRQNAFHIDYAFMSMNLRECARIGIGVTDDWLEFSDHMPLIVNWD